MQSGARRRPFGKWRGPAARRSLSEADSADIEARRSQREDPLFGARNEARFAALRQDILHWAEDAP